MLHKSTIKQKALYKIKNIVKFENKAEIEFKICVLAS